MAKRKTPRVLKIWEGSSWSYRKIAGPFEDEIQERFTTDTRWMPSYVLEQNLNAVKSWKSVREPGNKQPK